MTKDELDVLWNRALLDAIKAGEQFTRYHFAALVAEKEREACAQVCEDDAFVEQWKGLAEAAKRIRARKP